MRTIAVVNQKGGCGKTTTAINVAGFLAKEGRRTLVVDMDPQGHSTLGLVPGGRLPERTVYDVFVPPPGSTGVTLGEITHRVTDNLDLAPADVLLSAVPEALAGMPRRTDVLADQFELVRGAYDYVIVDCPPGVSLLTFNALKASAEAIVPVDPSFFSLHGIAKQLETFDVLSRNTGRSIAWTALVTLFTGRTAFATQVVSDLRSHLSGHCFETTIRYSVKLAEAASHGLPIVAYNRRCTGFDDYRALTAEVLEREPRWRAAADEVRPIAAAAPQRTDDGVLFTIEAPRAQRVHIVGDFNDWSFDGSEMRRAGGVWSRLIPLDAGQYRYRFVVDGEWLSDPLNDRHEPSPYGGVNSIVVVGEAVTSEV
jgi:chromosome partitioning protein